DIAKLCLKTSNVKLITLRTLTIRIGTYKQWKTDGASSITLSLRFPFYIALTDAMLSLAYTVNLGHTAIYKVPWSQPQCGVVGAYVVALFALNILLVGFVALSTWLRVCREIYVETGVYDYKLWLTTISISMLIVLISIRDFGPQKYWCAADDTSTIIPLIMLSLIALSLVTIIFCYLKVLLKIKNLDDTLLTSSYASPQRVYIEKRALRKLISYIFTFLLQFIPLLAYQASSLLM
ncbi:4195_t:CDS:2, partial [Acaulospora morrowiae]